MSQHQSDICIITTRNIFDAPCLEKYRSLLDAPFDIVYWDRCGKEEECGAQQYFRYNGPMEASAGKAQKLMAYIGFIRFVGRILKEHTYKKLIVFPTQAAWLIHRRLCADYKGRYIMDIRDYAGENKRLLYTLTKDVVLNAGVCSITSPAYRKFLPEREYVISHNLQSIDAALIQQYRARTHAAEEPIRLSFIGSVRFIEQQKKLLLLFKNDSRFHLSFIGRGSEQLKDYCERENILNVTLIGQFERTQLADFYMTSDMAINVYGNHDPYLDYALSNKLYSAAIMGMPILVSPETHMSEITEKYGIGMAVNIDDPDTPDSVYQYYRHLSAEQLQKGCDAFLECVYRDEEAYRKAICKYIKDAE
ncbi:MAG: glycosyltransferase family 4 protein [Clostridiales bacterium]|nr:glycosyltransferase family 4 protein [Clostridiales bacterium]